MRQNHCEPTWGRKTAILPFALIATLVAAIMLPPAAPAATGDPDGFDPHLNAVVYSVVVQPDGKVLLGGLFTTVTSSQVTRKGLARFKADGTVDPNFNPDAGFGVPQAIAVQDDGKVLLGGTFLEVGGVPRNRIARIENDGTLDGTFDPNADSHVYGIAPQADGKILVWGWFSSIGGVARTNLVRLESNGRVETNFNVGPNLWVNSVAVQADGKILLGGRFYTVGGVARSYLARVQADGTLDTNFNASADAHVMALAVQVDGKILLGGDFTNINGLARSHLARLNPDGTLDMSFTATANAVVNSLALQADGKILIGGAFTSVNGVARCYVARLEVGGNLDAAFNPNIALRAGNVVNSVALQADGKILLGGEFFLIAGQSRRYAARLENDPPLQSLDISSSNRVEWMRWGSCPESDLVTFELSTNRGASYFLLGHGVRINGGWELTGLALPDRGWLRARARAVGGLYNGSGGLVEVVRTFGPPEITVLGNGLNIATGDTTPEAADGTDFGSVNAAVGSVTRDFIITNSGYTHLSLGPITVTGTNAADFSAFPQGYDVGPGGSVYIRVTFNPSGKGVRRATLSIPSDDEDENPFSFDILGTGIAPEIGVTGNHVDIANGDSTPDLADHTDFGGVAASIGTVVRTFTITNSGTDTLNLYGNVTVGGSHASDFSVTSQPTFTLATNESTTFQVTFDPSALGQRTATLSFNNNDTDDSPFHFSIQGTGVLSSNANLAAMVLSRGTLSPVFASGTTNYTASVATGDASVTVTAARAEANATLEVQVNGAGYSSLTSGVPSGLLALNIGTNLVNVRVTAQDGTTVKIYTVAIVRRAIGPGDVDSLNTFLTGGQVISVVATAVQPDGKVIFGGLFNSVLGVARTNIARLNADGTLDLGFNPNPNGNVQCVVVQGDGKVLLGGLFTTLQPNDAASATSRNFIARVHPDGSLDAGFDPNANNWVRSLAVQPDGKIVVGGHFTTLQPNGGAVTNRNYLARFNADGSLDAGFDPNPNNMLTGVALQPDGKILFAGRFTSVQPNGAAAATDRNYVARVHADGTLDDGFDPKPNAAVRSLAVQADGKILIAGEFRALQPNGGAVTNRDFLARVHADGTLDSGFDPGPDSSVSCVVVQANGQVLLGGQFVTLKGNAGVPVTRNYLARINADSTLDIGFDPNPNGQVYSLALQADGKVLVGGTFNALLPNGASALTARTRFARLLNDPATQSLVASNASQVTWTRGGSSPEVSQVTFELSTNGGASWTPLGDGVRVGTTANWQRPGLSLPASGKLRARGRTTGGYYDGSSGLIESVASFASGVIVVPPVINPQSLRFLSNGWFQFNFSNADNVAFNVLATTNASLPVSNWTVLGTGTDLGGGLYQFADPQATNFPTRYYRLRFP